MSLPPINFPAPDFTLPSTTGEAVTLSDLRGRKVLLAFFPLAFTSTCTEELCAMSEDYSAFEAAGATILPISVDAIPSLRAYKAHERMTVDLLSDFKRVASRQYGVLNEEKHTAKRSYFLVDAEGILRWAHVEEHNGLRRENKELLEHLATA